MAADTFTTVDEWDQPAVDDFRRDQYDRPLILQPDGTRIGYTRSSTAAKTIEDTYNLQRWDNRGIAYGMAYDASLVARLIALGGNPAIWEKPEKDQVHKILDDARAVAQAHKGADIGTALHHLTHRLDRGEAVDAGPYTDDLLAYATTLSAHGLTINCAYIECRIVNDLLRMAGSADRIVVVDGVYRIADIKTGASVDFGGLGWAAQLAAYAGGTLYDVATEQRLPTPPIDQRVGYIIHLPAGQGRCDVYEIDLAAGHRAAELANEIRQIRKAAKGWITPKSTWVAAPTPPPGTVERPAGEGSDPAPSPAISAAPTLVPSAVAQPAPPVSATGGATIAAPAPDTASRRRGPHQRGQVRRSKRQPPDEGDIVSDLLIDRLKTAYNGLPADAQTWVAQLVVEGKNAGLEWNTGALHSTRRCHLGRAVVALAASIDWTRLDPQRTATDTVCGLLDELEHPGSTTVGEAIGMLNATEAVAFARLVDEYLSPEAA